MPGRKLNLNHLTDEECEQILKVIQRDFDVRQQEKGRLAYVPVVYTPLCCRQSLNSTLLS